MIVSDKESVVKKADEVSNKLLKLLMDELNEHNKKDDPADRIYLSLHILASFHSKLILSLDGYGKLYCISTMNIKFLNKLVNQMCKEYLEMNYNGKR